MALSGCVCWPEWSGMHPSGPSSAPEQTRSHCTHVRSSVTIQSWRVSLTQKKLAFLTLQSFTDDPPGQRYSIDTLLSRSKIIVWSVDVAEETRASLSWSIWAFPGSHHHRQHRHGPPSTCHCLGPLVALERGSPAAASLG